MLCKPLSVYFSLQVNKPNDGIALSLSILGAVMVTDSTL